MTAQLKKVKFILLCLIAFAIGCYIMAAPALIVLYSVAWLLEGDFKRKGNAILKNRYVWLFVSFYMLHVLGMIFTSNFDAGLFNLQVKLSLLVFPLLLVSGEQPGFKKQKQFMCSFITGCSINGLICIIIAIWTYYTLGVAHFVYMRFSLFLHPSYFSMYIDMSIVFIFYLVSVKPMEINKTEKIILYLSLFFLGFILVLLQSKTGMFISAALVVVLLIKYSVKNSYKTAALITVTLAVIYFLAFHFIVEGQSRVAGAASVIMNKTMNDTSKESTQARYYVLNSALKVIKAHPLIGVGTGDEYDVLVKQYLADGYTGVAKEKLNAHNQYIETMVVLGPLGLISLLACFALPFIKCVKEKRFVYGAFLVIVGANLLAEVMFDTQGGTIFYGLFNSLLMFNFVI
ncbi:MAG: O-antigen ligase family protein [Bacteroidia bacterium]